MATVRLLLSFIALPVASAFCLLPSKTLLRCGLVVEQLSPLNVTAVLEKYITRLGGFLVLQHYWCGRGAFRSVGYGIVIVGFAGDAGNAISGGTSSTSAASGTSTNRYLCFSGCLMQ